MPAPCGAAVGNYAEKEKDMKQRYNIIGSQIVKCEIARLRAAGFPRLEIARQILALSGVINHWTLLRRHGALDAATNTFRVVVPLP